MRVSLTSRNRAGGEFGAAGLRLGTIFRWTPEFSVRHLGLGKVGNHHRTCELLSLLQPCYQTRTQRLALEYLKKLKRLEMSIRIV